MVLLIVLAVILLAVLAATYWVYRFAFYSPKAGQNDLHRIPNGEQYQASRAVMHELISALEALPYEKVSILSRDGLTLNGKYYHVKDGAPLAICFHGYRGMGIRDFCGGSKLCMELGQNLLLIEERAQEQSGGHTISFGVNERWDCLSWIEYARCRFGEDVKVLLYGVSMGSATILMASGLDLPENVKGIVADCPYTSPKEIIQKVCLDLKLPPKLFYPFAWLAALIFGGFRLGSADAVQAVKLTKVPILLIHGEDDRFVPCDMSRRIQAANPEMISLYTFPGAGHGLSFMVDKDRYRRIVTDFIHGLGL